MTQTTDYCLLENRSEDKHRYSCEFHNLSKTREGRGKNLMFLVGISENLDRTHLSRHSVKSTLLEVFRSIHLSRRVDLSE